MPATLGMVWGEAANSAQELTTENRWLRATFQKLGQTGPSVLKRNLCSISHHLIYFAFLLPLFDLFWICLIILIYCCSWLQIPPRLFKFQSLLLLSILLFALGWFLKEKVNRALWRVSYSISHLLLCRHPVMSDSLQPHELQHTRLPCPSLSPRVWSNLCPLSKWWNTTISSSVTLSSSCPFSTSGSFPVSKLFTSGGRSMCTISEDHPGAS